MGPLEQQAHQARFRDALRRASIVILRVNEMIPLITRDVESTAHWRSEFRELEAAFAHLSQIYGEGQRAFPADKDPSVPDLDGLDVARLQELRRLVQSGLSDDAI